MRTSISTKWLPVTNTQGSRVKAYGKDKRQSVTDAWDWSSNVEENHCRVAKLLAAKLGWSGLYVGGFSPDGFVFVHMGHAAADQLSNSYVAGKEDFIGRENRDWFYLPETEGR